MFPEIAARSEIDAKLETAAWVVQDHRQMDLSTGRGVAVREFPLKRGHGKANDLLFVDRKPVGVEIKRLATGNQESIDQDRLRQARIPLLSLTEQERIAAEFERRPSIVDELETTITANLHCATRLSKSMRAAALCPEVQPG